MKTLTSTPSSSDQARNTLRSSTLRFHANAETDNALAKAIATVPPQVSDILQALHIPSAAWVFSQIYRLDRAQYLQDVLDGARKARAGRGGAGRAKPLSSAERKVLRKEIHKLRSGAQLPKLPSRLPLIFEANRQAALQMLHQHYRCIVRRIDWQARDQRGASISSTTPGRVKSNTKGTR